MSEHGDVRWLALLSAENAHVLELLFVSLAVIKKVLNLTKVFGEPGSDNQFERLLELSKSANCYLCASNCSRI